MKLIKLGIISAVVLFGVITLISLIIPSNIRISRAIDISTAKENIYPKLAEATQWEQWNVYIQSYHNRHVSGREITADEMAVSINNVSDSLVTSSWLNPGGNRFSSGYTLIAHDANHSTVQWYFDFHLRWYPWEKFQSIVYDQQFGPVMEHSLKNLKAITENSR